MKTTIGTVERGEIRAWAREGDGNVTLRYTTTGHAMDAAFEAFVDALVQSAPGVTPKKDTDAPVARPSLFAGPRVVYQALPVDRELAPFLAFLGDPAGFAERIAPAVRRQLQRLRVPAMLKVYVTSGCPFCPAAVSTLLGLASSSAQVHLTVIDGECFTEAAEADGVRSAPTIMLDDQYRWTGAVDAGELATLMVDRDPAGLGTEALKGMIEAGRAEEVARMMAQRRMIFPAFVALLADPRWSVRLGAMVAFESLAETDADLAGQAADPLMTVYADHAAAVRGDLLYVLGESGNPSVLPFLRSVVDNEEDAEVRLAAQEALQKFS